MSRIVAVQGLDWGSEAKGSICNLIAHSWRPDAVATAWHPNAGHTAWVYTPMTSEHPAGDMKYVHSMLPIGALAPSVKTILLGPGSVIDVDKLQEEMVAAMPLIRGKTMVIHPNAGILSDYDREGEKALVKIGSTMKGSMHAAIRKMGRGSIYPDVPAICRDAYSWLCESLGPIVNMVDVRIDEELYDYHVDSSKKILLEGAQGYGLGIHNSRFYPYCTSRDVSTAQLLADCRIPFQPVTTIGVCRTYPIRVANRFDRGTQIGTSGPAYPGQKELDWELALGRAPELTTVTKLPRRIFQFSLQQVREACRIMAPTFIALTFCDYLGEVNEDHNHITHLPVAARELLLHIQGDTGVQVRWATTSPTDIWNVTVGETGLIHRVKAHMEMSL